MNDCMTFPDTVEEFMEQYKVVDTEHIYTNGSELVPIFRMKQWFEHMPPGQPNTTTHDSIPAETGENDGDGTSGDCTSRTQAIEALRDYLVGKRCPDDGTLTCRLIENEVINKLPSIQPERKTGRWIYGESEVGNDGYYCSECGNFVPWIYEESAMNFIREYKFCPNCGAKMEGEKKE